MNETTTTTEQITSIEDIAAARWLRRVLAPARAHNADGPTDAAIDRIRTRVMGEPARRQKRTLAA